MITKKKGRPNGSSPKQFDSANSTLRLPATITEGRAAVRWSCPPGRRLPPFAKPIADAFLRGLQPKGRAACVWLDCWPPKQPIMASVACPWDEEPERFDWRVLAALDVFVKVPAPCDGDRLRRLLVELVAVKPRRLIVLRPDPPHAEFIISAARGLEVEP